MLEMEEHMTTTTQQQWEVWGHNLIDISAFIIESMMALKTVTDACMYYRLLKRSWIPSNCE